MHKEQSLKVIKQMAPKKRWELAKEKLSSSNGSGAVSELINHLKTHQNSRWLIYSPVLARQVAKSFAAHAFRNLQQSVLHYEIIRLCSFWDAVDLDSRSIPTIVALADCRGVSDCVYDDHYAHYENSSVDFAKQWGTKARRRLRAGVRGARAIEVSETLYNTRNYRDRLAHQLEETRAEKKGAVPLPRFGDEKKLLGKTITTMNNLYLSLNGVGFDWRGASSMHRRNAEAFWSGVSISVKR